MRPSREIFLKKNDWGKVDKKGQPVTRMKTEDYGSGALPELEKG
jgi:hypothetical protein